MKPQRALLLGSVIASVVGAVLLPDVAFVSSDKKAHTPMAYVLVETEQGPRLRRVFEDQIVFKDGEYWMENCRNPSKLCVGTTTAALADEALAEHLSITSD